MLGGGGGGGEFICLCYGLTHMYHGIDQNTLIANINSCISGVVVKLIVSASLFNPALLPDNETLLRAYGNSKLSTLADFYGEKAEVMLKGLHILPLLLSIKKNC